MTEGRTKHWFYQLSYSLVEPGKTPLAVVNVPKNLFKAQIGWRDGLWSANVNSRYMDRYESANFAGTGYAGDFTSTDLRVARDFKQATDLTHTLGVFVRNINDNRYTTVYGFPDEGRVVGVDYRLAY
jgi:outer membrane cobalamin receptor